MKVPLENLSNQLIMYINPAPTIATSLAVLLCSCAATSIKTTWKSPDHNGAPLQKVAVLAVEDRGSIRRSLEREFAEQLTQQGQGALTTYELLSLPEIKENKDAAAARLRQAGADAILIMRLVDKVSYESQVRTSPAAFLPTTTGYGSFGWHDYYSVVFVDMGTIRNTSRDYLYLDTSLYELNTGKRIWSCLTETVLTEDADRYAEVKPLVTKVLARLREDGLVR
jgi:hypothetical protein